MSTSVAIEDRRRRRAECAIITSSLCLDLAQQAKPPRGSWPCAGGAAKDAWLRRSAAALVDRREEVLAANAARRRRRARAWA